MATFEELTTELFTTGLSGLQNKITMIKAEIAGFDTALADQELILSDAEDIVNGAVNEIELKQETLDKLENLPDVLAKFQQDIS